MRRKEQNNSYQRLVDTRPTNLVVVAVEGEKTEVDYFEMLRQEYGDRIKIEIIPNEQSKSAPNHILGNLLQFKHKYDVSEDDAFWMVIDVDHHSKTLPKTIKDAKQNGCKIAISNPCFEIWLFLHRGNINITEDFVHFLKGKTEIARISRANLTAKAVRHKDILNKINHGANSYAEGYKSIYLNYISGAIKKSKKLLASDKSDNFLCEKKHAGKTKVGFLVEEIIEKLS